MKRFRILIADSHDVVRRSLRTVLEDQLSWLVVGETKTGPETVARTLELEPDVVVLDVGLPGLSGMEVTRQIARTAPQTDVVVLTMHASKEFARRLHKAGARGYVPKMTVGRRLVGVIQSLLDRRTAHRRGKVFVEVVREHRPDGEAAALTAREREVLQLLAEGHSNKEIGAALTISAKTVETHRARIMSKLQLRSVGQLVRFAIRHRIIAP